MLWKRIFDIVVSTTALVVLSPLIIATAVTSLFILGRPVFFRQMRPGLQGHPFSLVKFRTMRNSQGADGRMLPDAERLTKFGRVLRSTSIDELPELWNILVGDMSLVGPRPLLMEYLPRYSPEQARRHEARPGLTGWAQVNGRNALSWDEKFRLDVWYVDHQGFWLDLKILFLTAAAVVQREGIAAANHETMPEFLPNQPARNQEQ